MNSLLLNVEHHGLGCRSQRVSTMHVRADRIRKVVRERKLLLQVLPFYLFQYLPIESVHRIISWVALLDRVEAVGFLVVTQILQASFNLIMIVSYRHPEGLAVIVRSPVYCLAKVWHSEE